MAGLHLVHGGHANDTRFHFTDPLLDHLLQAIDLCDAGSRIDLCVSFIRQSGLVLLRDALHRAVERGAYLQVITSDYLDVTEPVALRELLKFDPARSNMLIYQSQGNRGFHLKSYLFINHKADAPLQGRAFVGSSNVSKAALCESLEWNWSLTVEANSSADCRASLQQLSAQVALLAQDPRVVPLTHNWIDAYLLRYRTSPLQALRAITGDQQSDAEQLRETPIPHSVQQEALEALQAARDQGYKRGVVVMATGLGKTWLSAFDVRHMQAARLLFVAHREEILNQARATFEQMAPNAQTGTYLGQQQDTADWLFASIQTIGKANHLLRFAPDHFDYIVVDEFHHAAAPSYRRLLDHFQPRFLLGLTATPNRTDRTDILALCDGNLVFERTLADAIEQHMLVPLTYHGILDDTVDYAALPWRNGKFEPTALENAFATRKRADHALKQWQQLRQHCTLAFCISTHHAEFMAAYFRDAGIRAVAVYAGSATDRRVALDELAAGKLEIIFSVDLFNEGTDLPIIDTVLMLRPTESRIVFLQQLGRGLRLHPGKQQLVVIDLVGNHKACLFKPVLLQEQLTRRQDRPSGQRGTPVLVEGCHINIDPRLLPMLEQIRQPKRPALVDIYRSLKDGQPFRPTALQVWEEAQKNGHVFDSKPYGGWFKMLAAEGDLDEIEQATLKRYADFLLKGVEATSLVKSFKLILLQALLEIDGLRQPPTLAALASHSRYLFDRHPALINIDLPAQQRLLAADSAAWLSYWKSNPIKHSSSGSAGSKVDYWFEVRDDRFYPRFTVQDTEVETLHQMVQELLDLRLAQYQQRKLQAGTSPQTAAPAEVVSLDQQRSLTQTSRPHHEETATTIASQRGDSDPSTATTLPYFPNLKIACGHFKDGDGSDAEMVALSEQWPGLDPTRHFLARASGNSMNGGKHPIHSGDLLLLELVTATSAGSITGNVMAIEQEDETGQPQYLLRVVHKNSRGGYLLHAYNPQYPDMPANEQMRTFARLKAIVESQAE